MRPLQFMAITAALLAIAGDGFMQLLYSGLAGVAVMLSVFFGEGRDA